MAACTGRAAGRRTGRFARFHSGNPECAAAYLCCRGECETLHAPTCQQSPTGCEFAPCSAERCLPRFQKSSLAYTLARACDLPVLSAPGRLAASVPMLCESKRCQHAQQMCAARRLARCWRTRARPYGTGARASHAPAATLRRRGARRALAARKRTLCTASGRGGRRRVAGHLKPRAAADEALEANTGQQRGNRWTEGVACVGCK